MYIQWVSTRKVKAITEELCGHSFSASAISAMNKTLDESLERFAKQIILRLDFCLLNEILLCGIRSYRGGVHFATRFPLRKAMAAANATAFCRVN
jgi:hypothetical protein